MCRRSQYIIEQTTLTLRQVDIPSQLLGLPDAKPNYTIPDYTTTNQSSITSKMMVPEKDIFVDEKTASVDVVSDNEAEFVIDPVEEKKVLRKLDRVIMPLTALVYFMQHLDKQSINYASVFGLQQDLNLIGQQFSWAVSLFYVGQLVSEYPAAYLMSRLPIVPLVGTTMYVIFESMRP